MADTVMAARMAIVPCYSWSRKVTVLDGEMVDGGQVSNGARAAWSPGKGTSRKFFTARSRDQFIYPVGDGDSVFASRLA